ncbi:S1 RNA-binding domain-containing protein 1 [Nymphon striatum]|nr:S1 RNA-binding domain-containing protein 1 [Nymphon striatum]
MDESDDELQIIFAGEKLASQNLKMKKNSAIQNSLEQKHSYKKKGIKRNSSNFEAETSNSSSSLSESVEKSNRLIKGQALTNTIQNDVVGWEIEDGVADAADVEVQIVKNIINLFDGKCTIPFIARYRKHMTNNIDVKKLIHVEELYEKFKNVQKKIETAVKTLKAKNVLMKPICNALKMCKSQEEINHIMAPYKEGVPRTLADRASSLGLGVPAMLLLEEGVCIKDLGLPKLIKPSEGLKTLDDIMDGMHNIIANAMAKDLDTIAIIRRQSANPNIWIISNENKQYAKSKTESYTSHDKTDNFSNYYSFQHSTSDIKSHQILAINRGEKQKQLKVTIKVPKAIECEIIDQGKTKWISNIQLDFHSKKFLDSSLTHSYMKFMKPLLCRLIRTQLTTRAENDSVDVFMENLKNLLLTPPLLGQTVMAIDPGFSNGCKVAIISQSGDIIDTHVIYPNSTGHRPLSEAKEYLNQAIKNFRINTIAIGNGKGCRMAENFISKMIQESYFKPIDVKYCIISEQGISIYSVSEIAIVEMPDLDPNLRSAVSLGRRLQDPLAEYIKVDPKHLGVGMYQHDISQKKLEMALNTVVTQCVSFVGVDLNISNEYLLRKVSGLNITAAKNIIKWRKENGYFSNREQIKSVKGIGKKTFEQCAGFVKILPHTFRSTSDSSKQQNDVKCKKSNSKSKDIVDLNPLDMTCIHPESYVQTLKLLKIMNCDVKEIGSKDFTDQMENFLKKITLNELCIKLNLDDYTLAEIIDNLKRPTADIRSDNNLPIFKQNIMSIEDLIVGDVITGQVQNVTRFGSFIDIGVQKNGLIPSKYMKIGMTLKLGDKIKVKVISVDKAKMHISLQFIDFI